MLGDRLVDDALGLLEGVLALVQSQGGERGVGLGLVGLAVGLKGFDSSHELRVVLAGQSDGRGRGVGGGGMVLALGAGLALSGALELLEVLAEGLLASGASFHGLALLFLIEHDDRLPPG
ncbi:hypothetical protein D3C86_1517870 [compost metagenome]